MDTECATPLAKPSRIAWLDSAKLLAMLFVAMDHNNFLDDNIDNFILAFTMPTFFFISGMTAKKRSFKEEIKKLYHGLLAPYFLLYIVTYLYSHIKLFVKFIVRPGYFEEHWFDVPKAFIGMIITANTSFSTMEIRPLWFMPALFWCRLLYCITINIAPCGKRYIIVQFLTSILATIVTIPLGMGTQPFILPMGFRSYIFFAIGNMAFPYLKTVLTQNSHKATLLKIWGAALLLVFTIISTSFNGKGSVSVLLFGKIAPLIYLSAFAGIAFILLTVSIGELPKWTKFYSQNTLILMPFHRFFGLDLVRPICDRLVLGFDSQKETLFEVLCISILAILVSGIPIYIITKYFPFIIGKSAKKRAM